MTLRRSAPWPPCRHPFGLLLGLAASLTCSYRQTWGPLAPPGFTWSLLRAQTRPPPLWPGCGGLRPVPRGRPPGAPHCRPRAHLGHGARAWPSAALPSPLPPCCLSPGGRAVGFLLPLLARVGRSNTGPGISPPGPFPWPPRVPHLARLPSRRPQPPAASRAAARLGILRGRVLPGLFRLLHRPSPRCGPPTATCLATCRLRGPGAGSWSLYRAWSILLDGFSRHVPGYAPLTVLAPAPGRSRRLATRCRDSVAVTWTRAWFILLMHAVYTHLERSFLGRTERVALGPWLFGTPGRRCCPPGRRCCLVPVGSLVAAAGLAFIVAFGYVEVVLFF